MEVRQRYSKGFKVEAVRQFEGGDKLAAGFLWTQSNPKLRVRKSVPTPV